MAAGIENSRPTPLPRMVDGTPKDTLFQRTSVDEDFVFNSRVVEVFDDMLDRSIPFYREVIDGSAAILERLLQEGDTVCDLGCATGTTILAMARRLEGREIRFVGIDNSPAMLDKARLKAELYGKQRSISYLEQDITAFNDGGEQDGCGAVICNYTLQFIRPMQRPAFLRRVHDSLRPGGVLLLSEKIISHDPRLNREFIAIYHDYKRARGYSELEISKKREALENVLIPFSVGENKAMLRECGFAFIESYFQWFNFASLVAVKAG